VSPLDKNEGKYPKYLDMVTRTTEKPQNRKFRLLQEELEVALA
jgi:hypothetical protein